MVDENELEFKWESIKKVSKNIQNIEFQPR